MVATEMYRANPLESGQAFCLVPHYDWRARVVMFSTPTSRMHGVIIQFLEMPNLDTLYLVVNQPRHITLLEDIAPVARI